MHYEKLLTFNGRPPPSNPSQTSGVASNLYKIFFLSFHQLNLTLNSGEGGDISTFTENGEWSLLGDKIFLIVVIVQRAVLSKTKKKVGKLGLF